MKTDPDGACDFCGCESAYDRVGGLRLCANCYRSSEASPIVETLGVLFGGKYPSLDEQERRIPRLEFA